MLDLNINPNFDLLFNKRSGSPVEKIVGTGNGWTKEVVGNVLIKPVSGRATLLLEGSGAMKINGSLTIGG